MNDTPCGNCSHFDKKWNECEAYCMHVDSDEIRESCKFCEELE